MRALLDVNVLIALLDADHASHGRAREWFHESAPAGWASCPITQNGCVRIMSHHGYPNALPVRRWSACAKPASTHHAFWPDDLSLLDERVADATRIHGPRQLTDLYLLALTVRHGGRFVTFDRAIALSAIRGAEAKHLLAL
jgi:toxin-antitoxin system PIN domain toxin